MNYHLTNKQILALRSRITRLETSRFITLGLDGLCDQLEESTPRIFNSEDRKDQHQNIELILAGLEDILKNIPNEPYCDQCGCTEMLCGHNKKG